MRSERGKLYCRLQRCYFRVIQPEAWVLASISSQFKVALVFSQGCLLEGAKNSSSGLLYKGEAGTRSVV